MWRSDRGSRIMTLTSMAATAAARKVGSAGRLRRDSASTQLEAQAAIVTETLGQMKGVMMKLGQMASYIDEGMPAAMRQSLASLQQDAPPMEGRLAIEMIERELGGRLRHHFSEFDDVAVAAASIGQVHRAVTRAGVEVAVKVQYPRIAEVIKADLDNTAVLGSILGMVFSGLDPKPLVGELRARITEELDYAQEAQNQQVFIDFYAGHPHVFVPRVHHDLSTERVLTSDFVHGARFEPAITAADQARRSEMAEIIFRYVFRGMYRIQAFNGDPHPGNYLFMDDGRIAFLDYGLVKYFTQADIDEFELLIRAMLDGEASNFRTTLETADLLRQGAPFSDDEVYDWFSHYYDIVMHPGSHTITSEYASSMVRYNFDARTNQMLKWANIPPAYALTQRINLGLYAILGRLNATLDYRAVAEELWPWTDAAPTTRLGREESTWLATKT